MREEENSNIDEHVIREIKKSAQGRLALEHKFFHCYARTHTTRIPVCVRSEYTYHGSTHPQVHSREAVNNNIMQKIHRQKINLSPLLLLHFLIPLYARYCVTACIKDKGSVSKRRAFCCINSDHSLACGGWNLLWCHTDYSRV